jgi:hypothetical protein
MAAYRARMMDAVSDKEAVSTFEGPEDLMHDTPVRVVRAFFEHTDRSTFATAHVDWELNAAFKNAERGVVTCMGSFHLGGDQPPAPFLLMIARS